MELPEKLVFHIPEKTWNKDHLEDIGKEAEMISLKEVLRTGGVISFYAQEVNGYYKGRLYPELLITLFCEDLTRAKAMVEIFENWFRTNNGVLKQEAFAYEWNGTLYISPIEKEGAHP